MWLGHLGGFTYAPTVLRPPPLPRHMKGGFTEWLVWILHLQDILTVVPFCVRSVLEKKQGLSDCPTVLRVWYSSNHIVFVEGDVVIVVIRILPGCLWIINWTRGHEKPCCSELATKSLGTSPQKKETASFMTYFRKCLFFATCFFCRSKSTKFLIPRNLRRKTRFLWRAGMHDTSKTCAKQRSLNGSVRLNLVPFLFLGNVRACFKRNWNQLHDSPNPPKSQTHSEYWWIRLIPSVLSFCFFQSEFFHTNLVQLQHFTKRTYKLLNGFPACQPFPGIQPCACSLQASPLKPLRALPVGK